jgi:hypothetical protein
VDQLGRQDGTSRADRMTVGHGAALLSFATPTMTEPISAQSSALNTNGPTVFSVNDSGIALPRLT